MRQRLSALSPLISRVIGVSLSISTVRLPWIAVLIWSTRSPSRELEVSVTPLASATGEKVAPWQLSVLLSRPTPSAVLKPPTPSMTFNCSATHSELSCSSAVGPPASALWTSVRFDPIRTGAR